MPRRWFIAGAMVFVLLISFSSGAIGYALRTKFGLPIPTLPYQNREQKTTDTAREIVNEESVVINVVKDVSPSVVSIAVSRRSSASFLQEVPDKAEKESGIGSGFIIEAKGIILTNRHVVEDKNARYVVITKDEKKYAVTKIFRDPSLDIAILRIDANGLKPVELGDSTKLEVGQLVIAVGNALGRFKNTVTTGVVSGIRTEGLEVGDPYSQFTEKFGELIQTDAAINPGNSGGPLLDSKGRVIGVNVAVTQGAQNIGFAIPVNLLKPEIEEFTVTGTISRAYIGVQYQLVSRLQSLAYDVPEGAFVQDVLPNSPAKKAGIEPGDVLTMFDGKAITQDNPLTQFVQEKKPGDVVQIAFDRDGEKKTVAVTLDQVPVEE